MADGVKNAGSIANEAGLGFEQFASIVAKVAEVTRQDGSQIGNTLKTTMARISRSQTGDPDVTGKDRSKAAEAYKDVLGIDLYGKNGEYRDLSDTLDLLSTRWNTLTDAQKNYLAEQSAGTRGVNVFRAMMDNYKEIQKLTESALTDKDYYKSVQQKWADSVEGKRQGFEASKQWMWNSLLSSGTLGGLYDAGSMGVDFASSIVSGLKSIFDIPSKMFIPGKDSQNTLSTVLTSGVVGGAGMSTVEFYKKLMEEDALSQPGGVKKAFKQSFAMFSPLAKIFTQSKKGVEGFLSAFKETGNQFKDNTKTTTRLSQAWSSLRDATGRTKDLEAIKAFKNSDRGTNALQALKNTEMQSLTGKIQSFALQHPVLTTAGASVAALGAVWSFVQGQIEKTEAQRQSKIDKATEQAQINDNNIQTLAQLRTYIEENKSTYQELAKGVHQGTNTNVSLSEAQFAKWTEMNNKIAELAPSALSYRDKQGNAVLNSQNASELTKLIRVEEQRVATETINSLSTFVDSYKAQNERQGIFDKSDNIAGDINTRIKALEWLKNIDTKDIQKSNNLWSGLLNGGQSMFKDALRFGVNPTDLSEYFNNTLPIKLKDVTEENRESFNAGIDSAIDSLKSSQTEMNNNFRTIMPQMVEKARTKTGVFGLQDRDWDNLSSVLSAVPDDILNELTTSDDIQGAITDYADRWIDGMKNGGRPFANALQKVLTTDGMSSLKQMEATMNRFLPKISDTVGVDKEDLIKAFGLEDVKQTVQQNQMLRKEVEMGKYINEPIEAQRSAQSTKGVNTLKAQAENQTKTVKKDRTDDSELTQKSIVAGGNTDKSLKQLNSDLGRSLTEQTRKQETAFKDIQSLKDNTKVSADYGREMLKSYNDFVNRNELNDVESFNALRQLLTEYGSQDWDLIQKKWDVDDVSLAKVSDKMGILENNLADIAASYDTAFKARASSAGASGMSDQEMADIEAIFSKTKGFDYDKLFEGTATGIHMNVAELDRLTGEYKRFEQAKYDKQISDLTKRWQECNRVIAESVEGSQDWYDAIEKRDFLNDYINDAREFQSRFEGIVNPVNQFMASLKGAEEGDDYDLLAGDKGVKIVEDLYAKGLVGTNKFKNFAQMLTNEDLSEKGIEGYVQAYESRYGRFKELFTEDGITGIGNGLDLMRKAGLIKTDENGTERIIADVKELSNALSISDSLASTFMKKLSDYGIDTPFAEETDNMRDLRKAAEGASQALSDTGKSFQVETDKTELKDVNKELDKIQKAKKKIGETDTYPNKEKDLQYLSQIEDYYKTLKGSKAVELYDTRTDKGQEQALDKATTLEEKTGIKIGIDWESENASYFAQQIDLVSECMDQLKGKDGSIHIETEGYEEAREVMEQLIHQKEVLTQSAILEYDTSGLESSGTRNQFKKVQNLAGAIQNYREKQALEKSGFQLRDGEIEQATSSIASAWKELKEKFPQVAEGLQKEAEVELDTNLETDGAINALEKIVGQDNIVEIMAELTGDQQVKNQLDEIVNQKYTAKIQASDYNAGTLNRYMHEAYDDKGQGTETFDYGKLDKQSITGMEASEIQVVAKVVNKGDVESLSDPVEKNVVIQYIENSSAWSNLKLDNKHEILVDYIQGNTSFEELPSDVQQVINRVIGINEAEEPVPDTDQTVNQHPDNSECMAEVPATSQMVNQIPDSSQCMADLPPVHQTVIRQVTESVVAGVEKVGELLGGSGKGKLNGTAHVDGTVRPSLWERIKTKGKAFLNGNWGLKKDETALIGEVAPELRVNSKTGNWELIGEHGAEFRKLNSSDIIFNHKQTEELFKNGYVTSNGGRGRVIGGGLLHGTAHVEGTYQSGPLKFYGGATVLNNPKPVQQAVQATQQVQQAAKETEKAAEKAEEKTKKAKKEQENFFDWIEVKLDRLTRKIDDLEKTASSVFHTFDKRAKDYQEEFDKIQEKIDVATQGIKRYQEEANKIELSDEYIKKIQDGTIDLEKITDETVNENISKYKEWWDKSLDLQYSLTDLKEKLAEIQQSKFDLLATEFDLIIDKVQHTTDTLENQVGIIEARGQFAGRSYYEKLMENEEKKAAELEKKYQALIKAREEALASGTIEAGSQADLEMEGQIRDVELAWQDSAKAVADYRQEIYETEKAIFELMQDSVSLLSEETEFIRDLLQVGDDDLFVKDVGVLNDKGKAYAAMAATNYNILMEQAQKTKDMIAHVNAEIASDPNNKTLLENRNELIRQQRDIIKNANQEKRAIQDLMRESYNRMLDSLEKLISKREELLQTTKDLYDYEQNVTKLGKDINSTKKILLSIENDDSEESRSRRQQMQEQLKNQEEDLMSTEWDKYIEDQRSFMQFFYDETETVLNNRLLNIENLLCEILDYSNAHASEINKTITEATGAVGYDISSELKNIWSGSGGDALSYYYKGWENAGNKTANTVDGIYEVLKKYVQDGISLDLPNRPPEENKDARDDAGLGGPIAEPVKKDGTNLKVGDEFMATDAPIYATARGEAGPLGTHQYFASDPHYKVLQDSGEYVLAQWYKGDRPAGWFKKTDLTPLATGGYTGDQEGLAILHRKERVLSPQQTESFEKLVNEFLPSMESMISQKDSVRSIPAAINTNSESTVDITFNLPNVQDTKSFMREVQNSKEFEKLVQHIAFDPLAKKSALRKNLVRVK